MTERLFGMETEYGFAVRNADGGRNRGRDWIERFFLKATQCLPNLPASGGGGIFLENGARFYVDCGHPEMTTPECTNPWDAVRYMHAGERLLLRVTGELNNGDRSKGEVIIFKTNVDHGGSRTTWGCHTSFLHRAKPVILPAQIIPHLVSRIIYTGAGGVEAGYGGLRFTVSPRVAFLECDISDGSTHGRGIFHTKDESLCRDGFHRLHIICGESLCSEMALWLGMGTTALVVAMIEMGLRPGEAIQLADPLAAMQRFSSDPTCTARVPTGNGRNLTAIEIQTHYLAMAEANLKNPLMPPWAKQVCAQWRSILERLGKGSPASVATTLDWAIKFCLFTERMSRRGLDWAAAEETYSPPLPPDAVASENPFRRLRPELHAASQELWEIDTRFGILGESGIFNTLDRAGVLSHRIPGVDNIEHAMLQPPAIGRAHWRGQYVQRYAAENHRYSANWIGVFDSQERRSLDLSHPFPESPEWKDGPAKIHSAEDAIREQLMALLNRAQELLDQGKYEAAFRSLEELGPHSLLLTANDRYQYLRCLAWVQGRRGFLDGIQSLDEMSGMRSMCFPLANDYVCAYRHQGLRPPSAIDPWIQRAREYMGNTSAGNSGPVVPFLDHCGYTHLRYGRIEEARQVLEQATETRWREFANPPAIARALADFADVCRVLGRREQAVRALDEAGHLQTECQARGEFADFTLTIRAKLEPDNARALALLAEAKGIQARHVNPMGEARTLLLESRFLRQPDLVAPLRARLRSLREQRPALLKCQMLAKIFDNWKAWTRGDPDPDGGPDPYWWL